ncbi:MAG: efflux RND transporter permease subunit [Oligoflexia bacterium]|nr:efflux RND transporter permease subunit [Oligoflexia bacterium]
MKRIYESPFRVYLVILLLVFIGGNCLVKLPVSLFPNSTRPEIGLALPYGGLSYDEFLNSYGRQLETRLRSISSDKIQVEELTADYSAQRVFYNLKFKWQNSPEEAMKETRNTFLAYANTLPNEIRDHHWIWAINNGGGRYLALFYSKERSPSAVYEILDKTLMPKINALGNNDVWLYNPEKKEVRIELNPYKMASLQISVRGVELAIDRAMQGFSAGKLDRGFNKYMVVIPKTVKQVEDIAKIPVEVKNGQIVYLGDIAKVDYSPSKNEMRIFRTGGAPSVILGATVKPGGNIKAMCDDLTKTISEHFKSASDNDIVSKILVDPSEFIDSAVKNVFKEVLIGSLLAVLVLFIFIGSFKNVITAAIEIPLSIVLAFILMKLSNMNLNLISLGGLALSVGMNVDASVVVLENIFRHFKERRACDNSDINNDPLPIIIKAVKEVWAPILCSTISSVVVFIPLMLTSDLSYAVLGDLAKTVIFSHSFSAVVALILVPTIRYHILKSSAGDGRYTISNSPFESKIQFIEKWYLILLQGFLNKTKLRNMVYALLIATFFLLVFLVLPKLPTQVIDKPDTDILVLNVFARGNTSSREMDSLLEETEYELFKVISKDDYVFTFSEAYQATNGDILIKLKRKKDMDRLWKIIEKHFTSTPDVQYEVESWNPSELPLPDPPQLKISVSGKDPNESERNQENVFYQLMEKRPDETLDVRPRPGITNSSDIVLKSNMQIINEIKQSGYQTDVSDVVDLIQVGTEGKYIKNTTIENKYVDMYLRYPDGFINSLDDIIAIPLIINGKLIPLKSVLNGGYQQIPNSLMRVNERDSYTVEIKKNYSSKFTTAQIEEWAHRVLKGFKNILFEDAEKELTDAVHQLTIAVVLSILLIFFTVLIQFGSVTDALIVLIAIPLGIIGVTLSLWCFKSTLSLNSILGVILLNGISVANSIILVDFTLKLIRNKAYTPREAVIIAAEKRLRPILITSLTTILGMLPIALGFGDGGKILRPLGIAVCGGLWISMLLTIFMVPAVFLSYHQSVSQFKSFIDRHRHWRRHSHRRVKLGILLVLVASFAAANANANDDTVLQNIIDQQIANSLPIKGEQEKLNIEKSLKLSAQYKFYPSLSLLSHYQINRYQSTSTDRKSWAEIKLDANLFHFGADLANLKVMEHNEDIASLSVRQLLFQEERDVFLLIVDYIRMNKQSKVYEKINSMQEKILTVYKSKYERGHTPYQDIQKAMVDLENASARSFDLDQEKNKIENDLLKKGVDITAIAKLKDLDWPLLNVVKKFRTSGDLANEILSKRVGMRVGIMMVQMSVSKERQMFDYNKKMMFPTIDATYQQNLYDFKDSNHRYESSVILTLSIPLFERMEKYSQYQASIYKIKNEESKLQQLLNESQADFKHYLKDFNSSLDIALSRQKTEDVTKELYTMGLKRVEAGLVPINELVIDQNRYVDGQSNAISAWSKVLVAYLNLCHTLGERVLECKR